MWFEDRKDKASMWVWDMRVAEVDTAYRKQGYKAADCTLVDYKAAVEMGDLTGTGCVEQAPVQVPDWAQD